MVRRDGRLDVRRFSPLAELLNQAGTQPGRRPAGSLLLRILLRDASWTTWSGLGVLLAALATLIGLRSWSGRQIGPRGTRSATETLSFLRLFMRHFARYGCRFRKGQTLREYLARLKALGLVGKEFDDMIDYVYRISYEDAPRSKPFERQITARLRQELLG